MTLFFDYRVTLSTSPQSGNQRLGSPGPRNTTHVRGHLEKEARPFDDGWLRVYEYLLAIEHMHIRREQGRPDHAQKLGEACVWSYRLVS